MVNYYMVIQIGKEKENVLPEDKVGEECGYCVNGNLFFYTRICVSRNFQGKRGEWENIYKCDGCGNTVAVATGQPCGTRRYLYPS